MLPSRHSSLPHGFMRHWALEVIGQETFVGDALRTLHDGVPSVPTGSGGRPMVRRWGAGGCRRPLVIRSVGPVPVVQTRRRLTATALVLLLIALAVPDLTVQAQQT